MMFHRKEAGNRRRAVDIGHKADGRTGAMKRGGDAVAFAIISNLLGLHHAAGGQQIGVQNIDGAPLDPFMETIPEIKFFPGGNGSA